MTTLTEGSSTVTLKPLQGRIAKVEGGTLYMRGDLVQAPAGLTWTELAERLENGDTVGSPFDLELVYDALTNVTLERSREEISTAQHIEDPAAIWAAFQVELRLDDSDALARAFSEEIARPAGSATRRRKVDVA